MFQIDDEIISLDIVQKKFCCDIEKCKGACCVEGEYGAPLEDEEVDIINDNLNEILPFVTTEGQHALKRYGIYEVDPDGDKVTTLINGEECAFTFKDDDGIYKCAIEKAFHEGAIQFQKPVSCHLYPIRVGKLNEYHSINYHKWGICSDAIKKGNNKSVYLYQFCKVPLIRRFGKEWYEQLKIAADELKDYTFSSK